MNISKYYEARFLLSSEGALVELCRLYGNLCYNNDSGRALVCRQGILQKILVTLPVLQPSLEPSTTRLLAVLPAFLQNFCISNPASVSAMTELISELAAMMKHCTSPEQMGPFADFLVSIDELESGRKTLLETDAIAAFVVHLITVTDETNFDQLEKDFLHLVSELIDEQQSAQRFISHSLQEVLLEKIEQRGEKSNPPDGEGGGWMKWACDLLTLLMSHAEPSIVEPLLSRLELWLEDGHSSYPTAAAALMLGNYCTSEVSCRQLLVVCPHVLGQLTARLRTGEERPVLHAVVGCLRNLAVCRPVRPQLLAAGVDQQAVILLLAMKDGRDATVDFKLVGLLRLLVQDNPELCRSQTARPELMQELVALTLTSDISGGHLTIEIGRLFSSLVRHGKAADLSASIITAGGLPVLTGLLVSPHLLLQNEGLVALALLSGERPPSAQLVEHLNVYLLAARLSELLTAAETPEEVKWNVAQVVGNLVAWNLTGVTEKLAVSVDNLRRGLTALEHSLVSPDKKAVVTDLINKLNHYTES